MFKTKVHHNLIKEAARYEWLLFAVFLILFFCTYQKKVVPL
jgi:hypothetical protein